jgi:UDP-glucose 4-epimerase
MADSPLAGREVLITGGAGFVGSHLADRLSPDAEVTVIDDLSNGTRRHVPASATFVHADLRTMDDLGTHVAAADVVFHQAALPSVTASVENPIDSHRINTGVTLRLLECARKHGTRVVTASSAAIYGIPDALPLSESAPTDPTSPYGIDKLTTDHYTRRYHDLYGLDTVALRYFNVYGPRQTASSYAGVISVFFDQARAGADITVDGDGSQTRDFVYVDDVVRANVKAATTDAVGDAYNIGTGTETSVVALAEAVRSTVDTASEIVHTQPRPADIDRSVADITKAKRDLGYEPRVGLETGIDRMEASTRG